MRMFHVKQWWYLWLILLVGCAQFGLQSPQTTNQRLYAAYGTAAQAEKTATNLLNSHLISSDRAKDVQDTARIVKATLDGYWASIGTTSPQNGVEVLKAINASLLKLEVFLAERAK